MRRPATTLLREPLVAFALLGVLVFAVDRWWGTNDPNRVITVDDSVRTRISAQWEAQMGRPPAPVELEGLLAQWIREEIYYREAMRLGLDENDIIIRRRMVQKLTFLTEDVATAGEPTDAALRTYFEHHIDRYRQPAMWSFSHRYFSSDSRSDAAADAAAALDDADAPGDPFMLQKRYVNQTRQQIAALFGSDFADALTALPVDGWEGPVKSAYGWHTVRIDGYVPARNQRFEEVVRAVGRDYVMQQREEANQAYFDSLKQHYEVVL